MLLQWKSDIDRNLPAGTQRAEVEKFLDHHGIAHSYVSGSQFPDEARTVLAFIRTNESGIVRRSGIQLKFRFNADQQLISYEAREVFTGP